MVKILNTANKRKKKKEYNQRKKEEARLLKEIEMREDEDAVYKRLVGAEEEETVEDEEDGRNLGIEDQIEEMNLLPPPAPVEEVVVNSPFAEAAKAAGIDRKSVV